MRRLKRFHLSGTTFLVSHSIQRVLLGSHPSSTPRALLLSLYFLMQQYCHRQFIPRIYAEFVSCTQAISSFWIYIDIARSLFPHCAPSMNANFTTLKRFARPAIFSFSQWLFMDSGVIFYITVKKNMKQEQL